MQARIQTLIIFFVILIGQNSLMAQATVPTAIHIGNAAFQAPIHGAKVALVLQEEFENQKRPVSTLIGEYMSDEEGMITVSLIPNKNYLLTTSKDGYYTQLSKIKTTNFSRTQRNKKGISLRPRNVISIKGNVPLPDGVTGVVTLTNRVTNYTRSQDLDANGDYDLKAVKGDDYELHLVVEDMMDTIITIDKEQLANNTGNSPFVYNFIPNAPRPNYFAGDILALESYNLKFIDRTHRISSEIWIDTLSSILKRNPEVVMEIQVHSDARKSDRLNHILCKKRAAQLSEELIERGVSNRQYVFEIKGEDEVLNDCVDGVTCSKREHAINNRVVLMVKLGAFLFKDE